MNKLKRYYLKIAVKSPVLIPSMAFLMLMVLVVLAGRTTFYTYTVQEAECQNGMLYTEFNHEIHQTNEVLFYADKNVFVEKVKIKSVQRKGEMMLLKTEDTIAALEKNHSGKGYIEIPKKQISIFEKIFHEREGIE